MTTRPARAAAHRAADTGSALADVLLLAGAVALSVLVFVGIGTAFDWGSDEDAVAIEDVTDVDEGGLSQAAYEAVELGIDKEELFAQLRPAQPVDSAVLDEYELRSPETVEASCAYFETAEQTDDRLYRFCFVEDELVEKTFVLPDRGEDPAVDENPVG